MKRTNLFSWAKRVALVGPALALALTAGLVTDLRAQDATAEEATDTTENQSQDENKQNAQKQQQEAAKKAREQGQEAKKQGQDQAKQARDQAKDAQKQGQDQAKQARDQAKEAQKQGQDQAKDAQKQARDQQKQARDAARNAGQESSEDASQHGHAHGQNAGQAGRAHNQQRGAEQNADMEEQGGDEAGGEANTRNARQAQDRQREADRNRERADRNRQQSEQTRDQANRNREETQRDMQRSREQAGRNEQRDARDEQDNNDQEQTARDRSSQERRSSRDTNREERSTVRTEQNRTQSGSRRDLGVALEAADRGLSVTNITRGSVIARAGIRQGDTIISVNGRDVRSQADFQRWVYDVEPRDRVAVVVLRDGREETVYITNIYETNVVEHQHTTSRVAMGVAIDPEVQEEVVIREVYRGGPAEQAGLRAGDVILSIDNQEVASLEEMRRVLASYQPGEEVEVEYARGRRTDVLAVELQAAGASRSTTQTYTRERSAASIEPRDNYREERYNRRNVRDSDVDDYNDADARYREDRLEGSVPGVGQGSIEIQRDGVRVEGFDNNDGVRIEGNRRTNDGGRFNRGGDDGQRGGLLRGRVRGDR